MSFWVRACLSLPVQVSPELLHSAIAERLELLTYLFCPEHEEDPAVVLGRLAVEEVTEDGGRRVFLLHYRQDQEHFIHVESWANLDEVRGEVDELLEFIEGRDDPGAEEVRSLLANVIQTVAFELKASDLESMGWPVAIACAAALAQAGAGLVQADGSGWMRPDGLEVSPVLDEQ